MRELSHSETLIFYDGPQLVIARDPLAVAHVCVLVETGETADTYLCIPVSEGRLRKLQGGHLDLREVFEHPETEDAYVGRPVEDALWRLQLEPVSPEAIGEVWLPAPGLYLEPKGMASDETVQTARARNRAVVDLVLRPPESWAEPVISAYHLSQGIRLFQRLVRFAYAKAVSVLDLATRQAVTGPEQYELEIFAAVPGSFRVQMQAALPADLVGYSQVAKALDLIDSVCVLVDDPKQAVDLVANFGGHFATAFKDLMGFISHTDTPMGYRWAMPSSNDSRRREVEVRYATPLYEMLAEREILEREYVSLVGRLSKVDKNVGTWRIKDELSGRERAGSSLEGVNLAGLVIDTQRYAFRCEQRLEEEVGTGRDITKLYLESWDLLPQGSERE